MHTHSKKPSPDTDIPAPKQVVKYKIVSLTHTKKQHFSHPASALDTQYRKCERYKLCKHPKKKVIQQYYQQAVIPHKENSSALADDQSACQGNILK